MAVVWCERGDEGKGAAGLDSAAGEEQLVLLLVCSSSLASQCMLTRAFTLLTHRTLTRSHRLSTMASSSSSSLRLTLSTNSSPATRAAALINAVYGQFVHDLNVSHADSVRPLPLSPPSRAPSPAHAPRPCTAHQLALDTPNGNLTALADITTALLDAAGKSNDALGPNPDQQDAAKRFLAKVDSPSFTLDSPDALNSLDSDLTDKTYCAGDSFTAADLGLFAAVHPHIVRPPLPPVSLSLTSTRS